MREIFTFLFNFFFGLVFGALGAFLIYFSWNMFTLGLKKPFSEATTLFFIAGFFTFVVIYAIMNFTVSSYFVIGAIISSCAFGKALLKEKD